MQVKKVKTSTLHSFEKNPRSIDVFKFDALKSSIKEFPEMMNVRPIIIDENKAVLCGNMRFKACEELGIKTIPAIQVLELSEERKEELVIKDNLNFGEWDWDLLEFNFKMDLVDKWLGSPQIDYSALDYEEIEDQVASMQAGVKKAIQLKIPNDLYEKAKELEKHCRDSKIYIGGFFIQEMESMRRKHMGNEKS